MKRKKRDAPESEERNERDAKRECKLKRSNVNILSLRCDFDLDMLLLDVGGIRCHFRRSHLGIRMTALLARKDISHLHCLLLLWPHLVFPFLLVGLDQVVEGLANPQTHTCCMQISWDHES